MPGLIGEAPAMHFILHVERLPFVSKKWVRSMFLCPIFRHQEKQGEINKYESTERNILTISEFIFCEH